MSAITDKLDSIQQKLNSALADFTALKLMIGDGEPVITPTVPVVEPPSPAVRQSAGVVKLRVNVTRSPREHGVYRLTDLFTTMFGSWEMGESVYSIPDWARRDFMGVFPMAGGDHNIYCVLLDENGKVIKVATFDIWHSGEAFRVTTKQDGFAEKDVYGSFNPDDPNQSGGWSARVASNIDSDLIGSDLMTGFGLPMNQHVSLFCVWRWIE